MGGQEGKRMGLCSIKRFCWKVHRRRRFQQEKRRRREQRWRGKATANSSSNLPNYDQGEWDGGTSRDGPLPHPATHPAAPATAIALPPPAHASTGLPAGSSCLCPICVVKSLNVFCVLLTTRFTFKVQKGDKVGPDNDRRAVGHRTEPG